MAGRVSVLFYSPLWFFVYTLTSVSGSACVVESSLFLKLLSHNLKFYYEKILFSPKIMFLDGIMLSRKCLSYLIWSVMLCNLKRCVLY